MPEGAWQKAWDEIQKMPAAEPPASNEPAEPQSWFLPLNRWAASIWDTLLPRPAWGQSYQWTQIGPAPFFAGQYPNAGFSSEVAIDPSDGTMNSLYLGTLGGIFKTTNGGQTWIPVTDDQQSQWIRKVVVHPTVSGAVFGGSGVGFLTDTGGSKAGVLRSLQSGAAASWCKIGPTWPPGSTNDSSTVAVFKVVFDSTGRLYAATDVGLYTTANSTVASCNAVTWTPLSKSSYNSTGLPMRSGGSPEVVTSMRVGAWSTNTLYASIAFSPSGNNGVYRSTDGGTNWTKINGNGTLVLPSDSNVSLLALAPHPGTTNQDTLYAVVNAASHPAPPACPSQSGGYRVYKATYGTSFSGWARITATIQCTTAQQCCENWNTGGCSCVNGWCNPPPDCPNPGEGFRSIAVSPTDENVVVLGEELLYRSTTAAGGCSGSNQPCTQNSDCPSGQTCTGGNFMQYGRGVQGLHDDKDDITFAADGRTAFIGTDGGVWKSPNLGDKTVTPSFQNINGDLANSLFYHGAIAPSNHGQSVGGMQDNGETKGGNTSTWYQLYGGDGWGSLIDPKNYNLFYTVDLGGGGFVRTTDGGGSFYSITNNPNGSCVFPLPLTDHAFPVAMDPGSNGTLVAYSANTKKIYRTTNATTSNASDVCWQSITANSSLPQFTTLAIAPSATLPSVLAFGGGNTANTPNQYGVWRTTNATVPSTWTQSVSGLPPGRNVTGFAFPPGTPCTPTTCTVYATIHGFNDSVPGHVFRSTDAGQTWQDISGNLPNVPAYSVAAHPTLATTLYVATAMGIYQGTNNGTSWTWGTFTNGFPSASDIRLIATHPDAGLILAWTYGRSVWEAQLITPPNPDQPVNTVSGVTGTMHNSTRITGSNSGQNYAMAWIDDRVGANNWHPYYRGYKYGVNGQPVPMATDVKVDDGSVHVAQGVAASGHPTQANLAYYDSLVAWYDDRLNPTVNQHIYFKYVGSDAYLPWPDQRADTHALEIKATNPAITWQQNLGFAIAWQADRAGGSTLHDIYARFFNASGTPVGSGCFAGGVQCKLNTSSADASTPGMASDASSNVLIAWEEFDSGSNGSILLRKFDPAGNATATVPVNTLTAPPTERHEASVAISNARWCSTANQSCTVNTDCPSGQTCNPGTVVVAWWERQSDGTQPEKVYRRMFRNNSSLSPIENQVQVSVPPTLPPGTQRASRVGVATDASDDFVVTWTGNFNDYTAQHVNVFARSFGPSGNVR